MPRLPRSLSVFSSLLLWLLLTLACGPTGVADLLGQAEDPPDVSESGGSYTTHVVAYGNSLRDLDQDVLTAFDLIIVSSRSFSLLEPRHHERALLYFNPWGNAAYSDSVRTWPTFQPAPGDLGEPDAVLNETVHCYRFDDAHVTRFLGWIESCLAARGEEVAGVFLDDFAYDRQWWEGDDATRDLVWGPADGGPGWREAPYDWNRQRIRAIETGARDLVRQYCGESGALVVNGNARSFDDVRRFAEDVGSPRSEPWERLEEPGVDDIRYVREGDLLQVNGMGASGEWGDWCSTTAGHGAANLARAAALAIDRGASVGLAYGVDPDHGGSRYSLYLRPDHSEQEWPDYLPVDTP